MPKSKVKKRAFNAKYHLFCVTCDRGWHFTDKADMWIMDQIHLNCEKYGSDQAIKCGKECANDWEMVRNANVRV